jgi:DNA-binding NarL/FixJ family response regulator
MASKNTVDNQGPSEPTGATQPDSLSILLAEPSQLIGRKIAAILSQNKAVLWVVHVEVGAQLLAKAEQLSPDLILADLQILKKPQTVENLRRVTPRSRVVALTGSVSVPYVRASASLGLDGMIEKGRIGSDDFYQILELFAKGGHRNAFAIREEER